MFAKTIIDSDAFLDMSQGARLLYYDLAMRADDDGFINAPKKIMRITGATQDELSELINSKFIIAFDSGVVVVKHWRIHNLIRKDRYKETKYTEEKELLTVKDNGAYTLTTDKQPTVNQMTTTWQPNDNQRLTQVRLGKDRIGKDSIGEDSIGEYEGETKVSPRAPKEPKKHFGEYKHVLLTETEFGKLCTGYGEELTKDCITFLDEYIEMKGYKAKSHYLCVIKWVVDAVKERKAKQEPHKSKAAQELDDFYEMTARWAKGENA